MSNLEISIFCMPNLEISRFDMQRDLLTRAGEREIGVVFRSLPDNPGRVGIIIYVFWAPWLDFTGSEQMVAYNILHTVTNILGLSTD